MRTTKEIGAELSQKLGEAESHIKTHTNAEGKLDFNETEVKVFHDRQGELTRLQDEFAAAKALEDGAKSISVMREQYGQPGNELPYGSNKSDEGMDYRTLGERFVESDSFKAWQKAGRPGLDIAPIKTNIEGVTIKTLPMFPLSEMQGGSMKTTMTTAAGWAPQVVRGPRLVDMAQRRPVIADLIPQDNIRAAGVKYMEETTFTNNAAAVAEGATKPEAALALTEVTVSLTKIAVTLPVTDEQLADVPQIRAYIDNRLMLMVELVEEGELLNGTGVSPRNFYGFLQKTGVQTQAKGADDIATAILKAQTKVRFGSSTNVMNAEPSGIVMHPTDYQTLVSYQLANGAFLFGTPAMGAPINDPTKRIWGMPIVVTPVITQGTALTGDFRAYSHISRREGISLDVGWANDDFLKNLTRLRCEERLTLEIFRASAFATITGL